MLKKTSNGSTKKVLLVVKLDRLFMNCFKVHVACLVYAWIEINISGANITVRIPDS